MRQGLRALLEESTDFQVVGEADNGQEGVHLLRELQPDVLVLDMALPDIDGVTVVREALRVSPKTAVIILSMHNIEAYVRKAIQAAPLA
jgi:DNA-binding NarL/FixJ family response regulator